MNASMTSRLPQIKIRLPELIVPSGAKPVGVHEPTGKIIYEMEVIDVAGMRDAKTQRVGPDGNPMWWTERISAAWPTESKALDFFFFAVFVVMRRGRC